jgi:hypothetical protein
VVAAAAAAAAASSLRPPLSCSLSRMQHELSVASPVRSLTAGIAACMMEEMEPSSA